MTETQGQRPTVPVDLTDPLATLDGAFRVATLLSQSSMVPLALRGSPQNCLVTMLLGRELGLSYIQAIRGIYVLPSGQPGLRGALLLARIRTAGHKYTFKRGDDFCTCIITRKDEEHKIPYEGTFTLTDARAADLVTEKDGKLIARSREGKPLPWEQYRRDMLQWRAVARAAGIAVPELVFGFDVAGTGDDGQETEPQPQALTVTRPLTDEQATQIREQLEQLNVGSQSTWSAVAEPADPRADYEVTRPQDVTEGSGQQGESREMPTIAMLRKQLSSCGQRGSDMARAASVLVRRTVSKLTDLTPVEVLIVHQRLTTLTREQEEKNWAAALDDLLEREQGAWADAPREEE